MILVARYMVDLYQLVKQNFTNPREHSQNISLFDHVMITPFSTFRVHYRALHK